MSRKLKPFFVVCKLTLKVKGKIMVLLRYKRTKKVKINGRLTRVATAEED